MRIIQNKYYIQPGLAELDFTLKIIRFLLHPGLNHFDLQWNNPSQSKSYPQSFATWLPIILHVLLMAAILDMTVSTSLFWPYFS